jgi:hypothetical protein
MVVLEEAHIHEGSLGTRIDEDLDRYRRQIIGKNTGRQSKAETG